MAQPEWQLSGIIITRGKLNNPLAVSFSA